MSFETGFSVLSSKFVAKALCVLLEEVPDVGGRRVVCDH